MFRFTPPKADIRRGDWNVRFVPIVPYHAATRPSRDRRSIRLSPHRELQPGPAQLIWIKLTNQTSCFIDSLYKG